MYQMIFFPIASIIVIGSFFIRIPFYLLDIIYLINTFIIIIRSCMVCFLRQKGNYIISETFLFILFQLLITFMAMKEVLVAPVLNSHLVEHLIRISLGNSVAASVIQYSGFAILAVLTIFKVTKYYAVYARLTLDSMPGMQMSIDCDIANNEISLEDASNKRKNLAERADFIGAVDGIGKLQLYIVITIYIIYILITILLLYFNEFTGCNNHIPRAVDVINYITIYCFLSSSIFILTSIRFIPVVTIYNRK